MDRLDSVWRTICQPIDKSGISRPSGVSGLIISAAGVVSSNVPPGASAPRRVSNIPRGSGTCSRNSDACTMSNCPARGSSMEKSRRSIGSPSTLRPAAAKGEGSMPIPSHPKLRRAISKPSPKPQPISRYLEPAGRARLVNRMAIPRVPAPCCR